MSTSMLSGNLAENLAFRGQMDQMVNSTDPSMGATRVRAALDGVDMGSLSTHEKNTLLSVTDTLARDGQISMRDADILVGLIDSFAATGRLVDTLTGGNNGQLIDVFSRQHSFLPFQPADLARYPGSALFGGLLGAMINMVVQKFADGLFMGAAHAMLDSAGSGILGLGNQHKQQVRDALASVDLSQMNAQDRARTLALIGFAAADGYISRAEVRAIQDHLSRFEPQMTIQPVRPAEPVQQVWSVERIGDHAAVIDLGRYELRLNDHNSELVLFNRETDETTRIWGDPHFDFNGQRVGDFYGTLTLSLEDGTKITIDTVPWDRGTAGQTLSNRLTITNGSQAIVVENLDQNTRNDLVINEFPNGFGQLVDFARPDGTIIYENPEGGGWLRLDEGGWLQVDREFLRQV